MKPENSQSSVPGFEQLPPVGTPSSETIPVIPRPGGGIEVGQRQVEQMAEAGARAMGVAAPASTVMPVGPSQQPGDSATTQGQSSAVLASPLTAADDELIEKEWVDRAKQIIEHTKDDPNARSQQVSGLHVDYIQKRFGRSLGKTDNS